MRWITTMNFAVMIFAVVAFVLPIVSGCDSGDGKNGGKSDVGLREKMQVDRAWCAVGLAIENNREAETR